MRAVPPKPVSESGRAELRAPSLDGMPEPGRITRREAAPGRITRREAAHVAGLARLSFTDSELDDLTAQLAAVLDHASDVEALDVSGLDPTVHPLPLANVVRDDGIRPSLDRGEVLSQAPSAEAHQFRVPPLLEEPQ